MSANLLSTAGQEVGSVFVCEGSARNEEKERTGRSFRSSYRLSPRRLERLSSIGDGRIDVLWRGMGKVEKLVAGGRVDGGEGLVVGRGLPFVVAAQGSARVRGEKERPT